MNEALNLYHSVPSGTWIALLGGGGVSYGTQIVKKLTQLENEKVVQVVLIAVALAVAGLQYLTSQSNLPPSILGVHTAALMGIATPLYFYAVKPLDGLLSDLSSYRKAKKTAAQLEVTAQDGLSSVDKSPIFADKLGPAEFTETGSGDVVASERAEFPV